MIQADDIVVAISYSGETEDLLKTIPIIKKLGCFVIGVSGNDESTLSKISDYHQLIKVEKEARPLDLAPTSSATATLVNNTDAVRGQSGFILIAAGLTTGPDQGGSVELVDDGLNNDSGSYVISNSSYTAADGRGALTVTRSQLGSSAASHDGHSNIEFLSLIHI